MESEAIPSMISYSDGMFRLSTQETSYWFRVTKFGHLEHVYYGRRLPDAQSPEPFLLKHALTTGSSVDYDPSDKTYSLDAMLLEWSGNGAGDYREPPAEIRMPDGLFANDFTYASHSVQRGFLAPDTLPSAYGDEDACETLTVRLSDRPSGVELALIYTVYDAADVITRRAIIENGNPLPLTLRRIMSLSLDLPNRGDSLVTFDGAWIKETHRHDRVLQYGQYVNGSTTGASSNRHNPGFLLYEQGATEQDGNVYGFNLVYSGNHQGLVERSPHDLIRVQLGIHPHCFEWTLQEGERFETPEAFMTFSDQGFNGMSRHFHDFINNHVVRGDWKNRERPVLLNDWEAYFFRFTRGKLLRLARQTKKLGVELFVLDDGWFGKRNDDTAGLGDYTVNRKKLPRGLAAFSQEIERLGMRFGLWFEPEMVNPDSDLFRAHPEYALQTPGRPARLGRNQLVLDLCRPEVRDYIVRSVGGILDEAKISYVKWDMNRHISDAYSPVLPEQGRFYHAYILGLYDVLTRIFRPRPHILLESCSSGGNRFDPGMLCFSPQVWASDDTDPIERLEIQGGLSYLYPLSTMGAHVSAAPHQQTLRDTPLSTRFNVSCFGCLGYELDLNALSPVEKREIREQIAFYKTHRKTLQFGRFTRFAAAKDNKVHWQATDKDGGSAVAGFFQTQVHAAEGNDILPLRGLQKEARYRLSTKPQRVAIRRFGGLIRHLVPVTLRADGAILRLVNRHYGLPDGVETYEGTGAALMAGVRLQNQFIGTGYDPRLRLLGDFGSSLYAVERLHPGADLTDAP